VKFLDHVKQLYSFQDKLSHSLQLILGHLVQGCTNLDRQVLWATEPCTVIPNTCGPSVWNLGYGAWNFEAASRFLENMCTPKTGECLIVK